MNPHNQAITIPKGTRIGLSMTPVGIESPYPVASAPIVQECGQFRATEKALWIAFSADMNWDTSSEEENEKVPTPDDLAKAWGGPVSPQLIHMYEEACMHLKCVEKLRVAQILSKYRDGPEQNRGTQD